MKQYSRAKDRANQLRIVMWDTLHIEHTGWIYVIPDD